MFTRTIKSIVKFIGEAAVGYEPAAVSAFIAAVFALLAGLGIVVGDLPDKADAVLTFLAFAAPIVAGFYARAKVVPVAKLRARER